MKKELEKLKKEFEDEVVNIKKMKVLEDLELRYFGRKSGKFTNLAKKIKDVSKEEKKEIGILINETKKNLENFLNKKNSMKSKWIN